MTANFWLSESPEIYRKDQKLLGCGDGIRLGYWGRYTRLKTWRKSWTFSHPFDYFRADGFIDKRYSLATLAELLQDGHREGFTNVQAVKQVLPLGTWPKDLKLAWRR